jgi:hypothetical protein
MPILAKTGVSSSGIAADIDSYFTDRTGWNSLMIAHAKVIGIYALRPNCRCVLQPVTES